MKVVLLLLAVLCLSYSLQVVTAQPCMARIVTGVDLLNWTEGDNLANGDWSISGSVATNDQQVLQSINANPTFYDSDFSNVHGLLLGAQISVTTTSDNDFIGFALGRPLANGYLIIQWKQAAQTVSGSCFHDSGMSMTYVKPGVDVTQNEVWCAGDIAGNTVKVTSGIDPFNEGGTDAGWDTGVTYDFSFMMNDQRLDVFVDGTLAMTLTRAIFESIVGTTNWPNGKYSFFNLSQEDVLYRSVTAQNVAMGTIGCGSDLVEVRIGFSGENCTGTDASNIASTSIDWGDGSPLEAGTIVDFVPDVGGFIEGSHAYSGFPANPLEVCITRTGGASGRQTCTTVVLNLANSVDATVTTPCFPSNAIILNGEANGGDSSYSYLWTTDVSPFPSGLNQFSEDQTNVLPPGTYTLRVTDGNGCFDVVSETLFFDLPQVSPFESTFCGVGAATTLSQRYRDSYSCESTDYDYTIDWDDGTITTGTGPTTFASRNGGRVVRSHTFSEFGEYRVEFCMQSTNPRTPNGGDLGCTTTIITVVSAAGILVEPEQNSVFFMYLDQPINWQLVAPLQTTDAEFQVELHDDTGALVEILNTGDINDLEGNWSPGPHKLVPGFYSIVVNTLPSLCRFENERFFELRTSPHYY